MPPSERPSATSSMTTGDVLMMWQTQHRRLSPEQRSTFLARPEVAELAELPRHVVFRAIESGPKLAGIVAAARILRADARRRARDQVAEVQRTISAKPRPSKRTRGTAASALRPRPKRAVKARRRGTSGRVSNPGPLSSFGTPGATSSYGSGMVRNPARVEPAHGYRCECGAWVPDGAAHDCF